MLYVFEATPKNLTANVLTDDREVFSPFLITANHVVNNLQLKGIFAINSLIYNYTDYDNPALLVYKDGGVDLKDNYSIKDIYNSRFVVGGMKWLVKDGAVAECLHQTEVSIKIGIGVTKQGKVIFAVNNCTTRELAETLVTLNVEYGMLSADGEEVTLKYEEGDVNVSGTISPITVLQATSIKSLPRPIVVIDPGHGGTDPGACAFGLKESNINLAKSQAMRNYLDANYEGTFLLTRNADTTVDLKQRSDMANAIDADFFYSSHVNAGGGEGYELYRYSLTSSERTKTLATAIHKAEAPFFASYGFADRGLKSANFSVVRETHMSAVLTESGFIDSAKDSLKLKDSSFVKAMGENSAKAVASALGLKKSVVVAPAPTTSPTASTVLYTIQVGAFGLKSNADAMLEKVKKAGFPEAFIKTK